MLVLDDGLLSPKRLWAVGRAREVAGSVFLDLEVPDCARTPLALSGVALGVTAGTPASGVGELGGVIPFAPTTRRAFAREAFAANGIVARRLDLPLADLAAGWYGLVVTATAGTKPPVRLRRRLAFVVR